MEYKKKLVGIEDPKETTNCPILPKTITRERTHESVKHCI